MAFDVYLMPTTASPGIVQVQAELRRAIAAEGGAVEADGTTAHTAEGTSFMFVDGGHFRIDRLSQGFCQIVFRTAVRTNSVVDRGGADVTPLRMRGVKGPTRYVRMRTDPISSPHGLCARLGQDLIAWNRFISEAQAEGTIGQNQELLDPPASPGTESRLSSDSSGVGARCLEAVNPLTQKASWTIKRTMLSQNPTYGVVWRADVVTPDYPDIPSRVICWKLPHSERVGFEVRPLEMFDPAQSVGPLPAEPPLPNGAGR